MVGDLDGAGFQEAPVPDKHSAAIAVVAHFEYRYIRVRVRVMLRVKLPP